MINQIQPRGVPESAGKLAFVPRAAKKQAKGKKNKDNNTIEIIQETIIEKETKGETELIIKIKETLIKDTKTNKKKDKARKAAFKKKNKNKVRQLACYISLCGA